MADVNPATNVKVPAPTNGTEPAKRVTKPREVPMVAVNFSKEEYAEVKGALEKLMQGALAGIKMDVPLGPFVAACALKTIRSAK